MKRLAILAFVFIGISATTLVVMLSQSLKDKIIKSFATGDVETLSTCFADDLFLELFGNEEYDDQTQIKNRLQAFFEQYPPKGFKIRHEGGAKHKEHSYLIGVLQSQEEVFRVSLTIKEDKIIDINITFEIPIG